MATEHLRHIIDAVWKGGQATAQAAGDIEKTGKASTTAGDRYRAFATQLAVGTAAFYGIKRAAGEVWQIIGEGAQLELAESRFDKLAASIGTTADALLGDLRTATHGMISDSQLMASASQIISLGLQDTGEGVVRLATLVSELGWDMNQVILTFANNSKMRLDALGLSISDVEERTKKFVEAGYSMDEAFDLAVIEAGEAKLALLGSAADTTAGDIARVEASWKNMLDALKQDVTAAAAPVLSRFDHIDRVREQLLELRDAGQITANEFQRGWSISTAAVWAGTGALDRYILSLRTSTEEFKLSAAEAEENRRSLGAMAAATLEAATQASLLEAGERELTYTTQAAVSAGKARAEALAAEAEALRVAEEEARALRIEYAGEFMTALNMAEGETVNFTNTMLAAAAQGGANAETLALLAAATGEYTTEQIRAALETAAMTQKAEELGAELAAGNITVGEALLQFQDFRAELEQAVVPEVDASSVTEAKEEAAGLRQELEAASGDWTATFNIVQSGGTPPGMPSVPVGADPSFASGTDGWQTVPGARGMPFPVTLHGGELFNVVPVGGASAGDGETHNYYITANYGYQSETTIAQDIRLLEMLRA